MVRHPCYKLSASRPVPFEYEFIQLSRETDRKWRLQAGSVCSRNFPFSTIYRKTPCGNLPEYQKLHAVLLSYLPTASDQESSEKVRQASLRKVSSVADLVKLSATRTIQSSMGGNPLKVNRVSRRKSNHNILNIQACPIPNSCPMRKVMVFLRLSRKRNKASPRSNNERHEKLNFNTTSAVALERNGLALYINLMRRFCAILFVVAPHQVALQHINFCAVQSIAELPTGSPKLMPSWLYRQHFAILPLNRNLM
ncbi:hypothetical protein TNCV_134721 [Trichonephila clavipes]|nr:hypothetical protein TNCV_134721 [Trichonephila clavipes]